jgi:U4/U6.U5 tri-snRNP component SNU23
LIFVQDGVTKTGVGWHCKVCDCFLKDSIAYLDHINGRKHQRNLGYSMRVERSTADQVNDVLARLTKEKEKKKDPFLAEQLSKPTNYEDVVKQKDEEERLRKEERARKRKERRKKNKEEEPVEDEPEDGEGEEEEVEEEGIDPTMAAMMGFSGFGGGNKNH